MTTQRRAAGAAKCPVDIAIESELWKAYPDAQDTILGAIAEASRACAPVSGSVAVVLADDSALRALNKRWRGQDKATNVLSFPAQSMPSNGELAHLGDIAIAFETLADEAEREGKLFADHLAHLAVHGYLHLRGHDHETDRDADAMERLETRILARIGVPDPYCGGHAAQNAKPLKSHA